MLPLEKGFRWPQATFDAMLKGSVRTAGIRVPTMHVTGWNDVVYRQTLILWNGIAAASQGKVPQSLIIGPWMHNQIGSDATKAGDEEFGPEARMDDKRHFANVRRWFDRHLKGEGKGTDRESAVNLFVMGANEWLEAATWPPAKARQQRWFLARGPGGDGRLQRKPVTGVLGVSAYVSDPNQPVPTVGGVNSHIFPHNAGPKDQAPLEAREDLLVFTSPAFAAATTLAGPLRAVLHVASSAVDTDFVVKLISVRKDGYARIIEDGILRTRYRESRDKPKMLVPGKPTRIEIDLGATAIRLDKGERLRVHVCSSNFPKYDRNPNTGEAAFSAKTLESAKQQVFHSKERASFIEVFVLPSGS